MEILELSWLAWVAASVVTCWLLPGRWRPWGIAAFALAFLAVTDPPSALILAAMAAVTWCAGARGGGRHEHQRRDDGAAGDPPAPVPSHRLLHRRLLRVGGQHARLREPRL